MRKGGYEGPIYERDRLAIKIERFQSSKIIVTYKVCVLEPATASLIAFRVKLPYIFQDYCAIKKRRDEPVFI